MDDLFATGDMKQADGDGILKAAATYFALVFGAGFVLGFIRVGWAAPRLGMRTAELMEMPVMLVLWLRGQTIAEYMARRDPVTGAAYAISLVAFVVMRLVVHRRSAPPPAVTPWRLTSAP